MSYGNKLQVVDADAQPYRALACAVIRQAIEDAAVAKSCNQKSTAAGWLQSTSERPLTFHWWCMVADLDPFNILRQLEVSHADIAKQSDRGDFWDALDQIKG